MTHGISVPEDWYADFFTAPVNRFWEAMVPAEATAADIAFVRRHLAVDPPARILDVPCGAGRHSLVLARAGYRVTGIDISADAIARARTTANEGGLAADFVEGDMRRLDRHGAYDAAICLGNSIGYFDREGTRDFLAALVSAVRPGGTLILDSYCCAETILPLAKDREIEFDGGSYTSRYEYDAFESTLQTEAVLMLDGERHVLRYRHAIVTSGALVAVLRDAGFATQALYGDTEDTPFTPGADRLLLLARRSSAGPQ